MQVDLVGLGLAAKWPKLRKLEEDRARFRARHAKASAQAQVLQTHIPRARNADIEAEAAAVLAGRKPPEATHESNARRDHERAVRERDVLAHALQSLEEQYGSFMQQHQGELFRAVAEARDEIGREAAKHAREAMASYARWADMAPVIKSLAPATPREEGLPAQRLTTAFVGLHRTTQPSVSRGHVEQVLGYLADLAPAEEAGDDAAA